MLVLVAVASVGIGLLISSVSSTDSQAIQLTMIVLLLSIFFTGFFLEVTGFLWPAWIITLLLPMSYAVYGFQQLMLVGNPPQLFVWIGLGVVTLIYYGLTAVIMRRQYRNVLD
jgi:ABC-2 type transport system permease protein